MSRLLLVVVLTGLAGVAAADPSHVSINAAADDSDTLRRALTAWTDGEHIDVSIASVTVDSTAGHVDVNAQIQIALSDDRGHLLAVVSGGAKAEVSRHSFRTRDLPGLRAEALTAATEGVLPKLRAHVRSMHAGRPAHIDSWTLLASWVAHLAPLSMS